MQHLSLSLYVSIINHHHRLPYGTVSYLLAYFFALTATNQPTRGSFIDGKKGSTFPPINIFLSRKKALTL